MRPFIQMCERTFQLVYRPGCDLSHLMKPVVLLKGECGFMFIMPTNQLSSTWNCFRYVRQKVGTYVHLIFTLERTRQDVHKLHKFWIQAVQQQNFLSALWIQYTFWTKGIACTCTTFIQVQNFTRNFSSVPHIPVVQCAKIGRACQKQWLLQN